MKFVKTPLMVFILAIVLIIATAFAALRFHWEDVHTYYAAGQSLLKGRIDLYAADFADSAIMDYRYPPFFLILFLPFCLLPYDLVEFIWIWLNIAAVYLTVIALKHGFEIITPNPTRLRLVLFLSFFPSAKYLFMLLQHFNVHLILIGLVFGTFYLLLKQKQILASVLMALAISFKIVPILVLPYFALKKQWLFLSMTAVFIVAFSLIPAFYFGFELNFQLLKDWYYHVMVNNEFHEINGPLNLSLKGQLERYLVEIDYIKRTFDPEYRNVNVLSLSQNQADAIWKFSASAMFLATLFLIWFSAKLRKQINPNSDPLSEQRSQTPVEFDFLAFHEFGLMVCLMLLVAPRTNGYYLVALFLPLIPLIHALFRKKSKFNVLALSLIVMATCILPLLPGRHTQRFLLVLGVDFFAALVLWIALAYNLYQESLDAKRNLEN